MNPEEEFDNDGKILGTSEGQIKVSSTGAVEYISNDLGTRFNCHISSMTKVYLEHIKTRDPDATTKF